MTGMTARSQDCINNNDNGGKIIMTLAEYILNSNEDEITVTDECFDMETYFYPFDMEEKWDRAMRKFAEMLTVKEINHGIAIVNLSEVIENNLQNLKKADLFTKCSLNAVMGSIESIIAGNVSEQWFERFVNALEG